MTDSSSIINLGDLSKPATVLIEKIAEATGGIFRPWQIARVAKAKAKAEKIRSLASLENTILTQRALRRFVLEESKKQENIENITKKAIPQLSKSARPENVDPDWIINFFDKSRLVSNTQMQKLWSRILAGEANVPGSFSKRTVNFMSTIDKGDAELFTNLCRFIWVVRSATPLIFDTSEEIYGKLGINFSTLVHLDSIGLIQFDEIAGYIRRKLPNELMITYNSRALNLTFNQGVENDLEIGKVLLTQVGREFLSICKISEVAGFFDYVADYYVKKGITVSSSYQSQENSNTVTKN